MNAADNLAEALRDVLPYAEACIGQTWKLNPPYDSVITAAREALAAYEQEKAAERTRGMEIRDLLDPNTHEGPTPFGGRRTDRSRT